MLDETLKKWSKNKRYGTCEHLFTLKRYAEVCDHITEFGVERGASTLAFIAGRPKKLVSYDIKPCSINSQIKIAKEEGIDFTFTVANDLEVDIEETDLLFIDTHHTYGQLKAELYMHESKVRKYIIMHDTEKFQGLRIALSEFLISHNQWSVFENYLNGYGLTIITRKKNV
jgi:hypothetical protein